MSVYVQDVYLCSTHKENNMLFTRPSPVSDFHTLSDNGMSPEKVWPNVIEGLWLLPGPFPGVSSPGWDRKQHPPEWRAQHSTDPGRPSALRRCGSLRIHPRDPPGVFDPLLPDWRCLRSFLSCETGHRFFFHKLQCKCLFITFREIEMFLFYGQKKKASQNKGHRWVPSRMVGP